MTMTPLEQLMSEMEGYKSWATDKIAEGLAPVHDEVQRATERLDAAMKGLDEWRRSQLIKMDSSGRLIVREGKFAGLGFLELAIVEHVLRHRSTSRPTLVQQTTIAELDVARNQLAQSFNFDSAFEWEEHCLKQLRVVRETQDMESASRFRNSLTEWRSLMIRAVQKAMDSTTSGAGDELVPTLEAAQLWMDVNLEARVLPLFTQSPMPSNPFDIGTQIGDVNWYPTTENVQSTTTTPTTAKTTLTAYGLKAGIPFSDELSEDAVIAMAAELRSTLARNASEVIDDVILNGDTTVLNGINSDGVTIGTDTAGKAQWLLGFDGLIHLPLIDNTSQAKAHSSTPTAAMFNNNDIKLGKYTAPGRRGDVVHISDINTHIASRIITEVLTVDKMGPRATISSGELASVFGTPYIMSEQMKLADTDGKVTDSGGNTTGRVLTLNTTQWRIGIMRPITFEADREPGKSQTTLYTSMRIALTERSGTRSSASHTALQYDISSVT